MAYRSSTKLLYGSVVEHILLSEFDIDYGSRLSIQFPYSIPIPPEKTQVQYEDLIANLMLPDGSQELEWDHSNFILYRAYEKIENRTPLYAINVVYRKLDSTVRRGAVVKALAILSRYPELCMADGWATGIFPLCRQALLQHFEDNNSKSEPDLRAIEELFTSLNRCSLSRADIGFLSYATRPIFQAGVCNYRGRIHQLRIPMSFSSSFKFGSISNLIRVFGLRSVLDLYRAIILEKNVLFVAHKISASELCTQVLAATTMVTPVIDNLLEGRVFPYVSLNDLSFESVPGFIAGTTNPVLVTTCNYDLLVDLNEEVIRPKVKTKKPKKLKIMAATNSIDEEFARYLEVGMDQLQLGETWIKRQFQTYTIRLYDLGLKHSDTPVQFYETYSYYVPLLPNCRWVITQKLGPQIPNAATIRQLCYAMNHLYKDSFRNATIVKSLENLFQITEDKATLRQVIGLLLKYFGSVDLTDAIDRVTNSSDHAKIEEFQTLNARLMSVFSELAENCISI